MIRLLLAFLLFAPMLGAQTQYLDLPDDQAISRANIWRQGPEHYVLHDQDSVLLIALYHELAHIPKHTLIYAYISEGEFAYAPLPRTDWINLPRSRLIAVTGEKGEWVQVALEGIGALHKKTIMFSVETIIRAERPLGLYISPRGESVSGPPAYGVPDEASTLSLMSLAFVTLCAYRFCLR